MTWKSLSSMLSLVLSLLVTMGPAMAAPVDIVRPQASALEIYPNDALLIGRGTVSSFRSGRIRLVLPGRHDLSSLEIALRPRSCRMEGLYNQGEAPIKGGNITRSMEALERERERLENRHTALMQQVGLLENLPTLRPRVGGDDLGTLLEMMEKRIPSLLDKAGDLARKIDEITRKIKELEERLASRNETSFALDISCPQVSPLEIEVRYPVELQRRRFGYEIMGDTTAGQVEIRGRLMIKQATGREWRGIEVRYFTAPKNRSVAPPPFHPIYLAGEGEVGSRGGGSFLLFEAAQPMPARKAARPAPKRVETFSRDVYEMGPVTIPAGQELPLTLFTYRLSAPFKVEIDGYATATPFLAAKVKAPVFLPSAPGRIFLDGALVGRVRLDAWPKGEERNLYFGEDTRVKVTKRLDRRHTDHSLFGGKVTEVTQWRYEVENLHNKPMEVVLTERVPISSSDKVEVEAWGRPQWSKKEKNGKVQWELRLAPKAKQTILFGTKVKRPK